MSLVPKIYSSADPGAPLLSGQPSQLLSVLDAILVDGFGNGETAKESLGWSREYAGPDKRAYRNDSLLGTGSFLRVDDSGTRFARLSVFSEMQDIDSGYDETPVGGQVIPKSTLQDSTGRWWWAIGNCRSLYLFVNVAGQPFSAGIPYFVGDFVSNVPADKYSFGISETPLGSYSGSGAASSLFMGGVALSSSFASTATGTRLLALRGANGIPGSKRLAALAPFGVLSRNGSEGVSYPDPISGGLIVTDLALSEGANQLRGRFPGLLSPLHSRPLADMAVHSELNAMARNFNTYDPNSTTYPGQVLFDLGGDLW